MDATLGRQDAALGDDPLHGAFARAQPSSLQRANQHIFYAACFFLSWQLLRVPEWNFSFSDGLFVANIAILLTAGRLNPAMFGRLTPFWIAGYTMLCGGLLLGTLANGEIVRWMIISMQYFFAFLLIPMVLSSVNYETAVRGVIAFIFGVAVSQLIGLIALQTFSYSQLNAMFGPTVFQGNGRLGAMSAEPNSNGAMCVYALVILCYLTLLHRVAKPRALLFTAPLIAGLISSASFTGFTVALLAIPVLLALTRFSALLQIGIPISLLALAYVALGGPIPQIFIERVADAMVSLDPSKAGTFAGRDALIAEAWQFANDNYIIGLGADRYREISNYANPVHNLPLLLLNEGGIVSFVGLGLLLGCMAAAAIGIARQHRLDGAACIAITLVFTIYTMSLPHMYARLWLVPVMLVFAVAVARPHMLLTATDIIPADSSNPSPPAQQARSGK